MSFDTYAALLFIGLKGTSKNALFPRLRRQLRARILMYHLYTAVLRAVLPCTHEKITIFRGTLNLFVGPVAHQVIDYRRIG